MFGHKRAQTEKAACSDLPCACNAGVLASPASAGGKQMLFYAVLYLCTCVWRETDKICSILPVNLDALKPKSL